MQTQKWVRFGECSLGIYQNLTRLSLTFNITFPWLFKGIFGKKKKKITGESIGVPAKLEGAPKGPPLRIDDRNIQVSVDGSDFYLPSCSLLRV